MQEQRRHGSKPPLDAVWRPVCRRQTVHSEVKQDRQVKHRSNPEKSPDHEIPDWRYFMPASALPRQAKRQRTDDEEELGA